jgi:hypothetical protein
VAVDFFEQVDIAQNARRFCLYSHAALVLIDNLKAFACVAEAFFAMHIWVAHSARAYHTRLAFSFERILKKLGRILLDGYILKPMVEAVAIGTAVAIDAPVRAAAVYVHSVFCG